MHYKVELQPAYLLHSRPYRDTSVLLDFLTRDHGRVSLMGKGVRRPTSRLRGILQPFNPLLVSFTGKSSLKTLTHAESAGMFASLRGEALFSAMYLNELLTRLLHEQESDPGLFELYGKTLVLLMHGELEPVLRSFELDLLDSLGYGISFEADASHGDAIESNKLYHLDPESGFVPIVEQATTRMAEIFTGKAVLAIANRDFKDADARNAAKKMIRTRLNFLLGNKPLKSRRLFVPSAG